MSNKNDPLSVIFLIGSCESLDANVVITTRRRKAEKIKTWELERKHSVFIERHQMNINTFTVKLKIFNWLTFAATQKLQVIYNEAVRHFCAGGKIVYH